MVKGLSPARVPLVEAARAAETGESNRLKTQALKALAVKDISGPELTKAVELLVDAGFTEAAIRGLRRHCEGKAPLAAGFARLGALWFEQGKPGPAAHALQRALRMRPDDRQSAFLLADLRLQERAEEAAEAVWSRLFEARPDDADIRLRAATQMAHFGASAAATRFVGLARPLHDDPAEFAFMAAAITRDTPPALPDPSYIARLFDRTAGHYDQSLAGVQYRGPAVLSEGLAALGIGPGAALAVLDAGCGSGLAAPVLAPVSARLDGLDLSEKILVEAAKTGAYDSLFTHDLARSPLPPPQSYDLIAAIDVLIYTGDMTAPLRHVAGGLRPGGRLLMTAELAPEAATGWELGPTGRYRHSPDYLRARLAEAGFLPPDLFEENPLRNEFRRPVPGVVVSARLP